MTSRMASRPPPRPHTSVSCTRSRPSPLACVAVSGTVRLWDRCLNRCTVSLSPTLSLSSVVSSVVSVSRTHSNPERILNSRLLPGCGHCARPTGGSLLPHLGQAAERGESLASPVSRQPSAVCRLCASLCSSLTCHQTSPAALASWPRRRTEARAEARGRSAHSPACAACRPSGGAACERSSGGRASRSPGTKS